MRRMRSILEGPSALRVACPWGPLDSDLPSWQRGAGALAFVLGDALVFALFIREVALAAFSALALVGALVRELALALALAIALVTPQCVR